MKVMVTGGAGYIGTHTVVELLNAGYEVVIFDNFYNSCPKALERVRTITGKDFKFYEADMLDKEKMEEIFMAEKPEAVIHFAGLKAVGESVAKPWFYYNNNIVGTLNILDAMKKSGTKQFVFSSSATVYGDSKVVPVMEDFPTSATNPYGQTKLMQEIMLTDIAKANPDMTITLLRYFNPVGAHESGLIGEDPQGIPNNLTPYIAQVAIGKREQLSVFGGDYNTHDGTGVRDFIHVVDLAKGHLRALEAQEGKNGIFTYNLGTGVGYSVLDMVKAFEKASGVTIKYQIVDRRPGDVAALYADPAKAREEIGFVAEKNLDDMCRDLWNWQKNNPNGYNS